MGRRLGKWHRGRTRGIGAATCATEACSASGTCPSGARSVAQPIVGLGASSGGYYLVAADGEVFNYRPPFLGPKGGQTLNEPAVGMTAGSGDYYLVGTGGGVFELRVALPRLARWAVPQRTYGGNSGVVSYNHRGDLSGPVFRAVQAMADPIPTAGHRDSYHRNLLSRTVLNDGRSFWPGPVRVRGPTSSPPGQYCLLEQPRVHRRWRQQRIGIGGTSSPLAETSTPRKRPLLSHRGGPSALKLVVSPPTPVAGRLPNMHDGTFAVPCQSHQEAQRFCLVRGPRFPGSI